MCTYIYVCVCVWREREREIMFKLDVYRTQNPKSKIRQSPRFGSGTREENTKAEQPTNCQRDFKACMRRGKLLKINIQHLDWELWLKQRRLRIMNRKQTSEKRCFLDTTGQVHLHPPGAVTECTGLYKAKPKDTSAWRGEVDLKLLP